MLQYKYYYDDSKHYVTFTLLHKNRSMYIWLPSEQYLTRFFRHDEELILKAIILQNQSFSHI